jgi:ABC-type polysaccharide/polyol phosphate transport system ATPase subunit
VTPTPVTFHHVWKKYRRGEVHDSLRDVLSSLARRAAGRPRPAGELGKGDFWALSDVSFEVRYGEALGIVGANGAGKSTVLKLLTRIVRPTRGDCGVAGRVGALIELAAGFHPDLTGRENVFLQGAIMGMRRAEIARKFDEIVAFAGIDDFIETPVKRYSSGMHARLGFAVAAHLDPDVLIIDEVLGVGDAAFQRKAFARIEAMRRSQIPLVVVSHQVHRIVQLCTHAILLDRGRVAFAGAPGDTIAAYMNTPASIDRPPPADAGVALHSMHLTGPSSVSSGGELTVTLHGTVLNAVTAARQAVHLRVHSAETPEPLFSTNTALCGVVLPTAGSFELDVTLQMNVPAMVYRIHSRVWDTDAGREVCPGPAVHVRVTEGPAFFGAVQMNPRIRLRAVADSDSTPRGERALAR